MIGKVRTQKWITREDCKANPETIYLFGDNFEYKGMGGQAKEMRGEPNARGIPTKWKPSMHSSAFFDDSTACLDAYKEKTKELFKEIYHKLLDGYDIVIPEDGLGTNRAKLEEKAPRIFRFINWYITFLRRVSEEYHYETK